jgi:hypothetical protein
MAVLIEKKSVIAAVVELKPVDLAIGAMAFPAEFVHDTQKVEFDRAEEAEEIAIRGSFAKQANIVTKDGFERVTVNPMQINEGIADEIANLNKAEIGESEYGDKGGISAGEKNQLKDALTTHGKLKGRNGRRLKKSFYDVLVTGIVTVSADGAVSDTIDYVLTNKIVNDNSTAGKYQWNDTTNSDPIEQLTTEALAMGNFIPDTFVLSSESGKAFNKHPFVRTVDNTTTGKQANFVKATKADAGKSTKFMKYLGEAQGTNGVFLEIYQELQTYGASLRYLDKNYAVGFTRGNRKNGQVHYGNIPEIKGSDEKPYLTTFVGVQRLSYEAKRVAPVGIVRYFQSSPLPTMNQPKGYISIKATLI